MKLLVVAALLGAFLQDRPVTTSMLCGRLEQVTVKKPSEPYRYKGIRGAVLEVFGPEECCENAKVLMRQTTGLGGRFKIKGLQDGEYWLQVTTKGQQMRIKFRLDSKQKNPSDCWEKGFLVMNGKLSERTIVTLD